MESIRTNNRCDRPEYQYGDGWILSGNRLNTSPLGRITSDLQQGLEELTGNLSLISEGMEDASFLSFSFCRPSKLVQDRLCLDECVVGHDLFELIGQSLSILEEHQSPENPYLLYLSHSLHPVWFGHIEHSIHHTSQHAINLYVMFHISYIEVFSLIQVENTNKSVDAAAIRANVLLWVQDRIGRAIESDADPLQALQDLFTEVKAAQMMESERVLDSLCEHYGSAV